MAAPAFGISNNSDVAEYAAAVTPSDATTFSVPTRALYVGATGNVRVRFASDQTLVTFVGCQAGQILPVRVDRVLSTSTTATSIVALW
jgi:hypothetical protein